MNPSSANPQPSQSKAETALHEMYRKHPKLSPKGILLAIRIAKASILRKALSSSAGCEREAMTELKQNLAATE